MDLTMQMIDWMISYRGGMGNRIDAFDIKDFMQEKGDYYELWKQQTVQHEK